MPLPRRRSSLANLASVLALLAVTACGGGEGGGDPPTGVDNTVTQISLSQGATTLTVGGTTTYTAQPRNAAGTAVSGQTVAWTSSDPSVASISGGVVTAIKPGTTNVVAAVGSATAAAVVTVTAAAPPAVNTVEVTPAVVNLRSGQTAPLTVVLKDASGATLTGRTVTWTSNSASVSVSSAGVVTAVSPGTATITATSEGKTGTATVRVDDVAPSLVSFTASPLAVNVGTAAQTVTFTGRVTDAGVGVAAFYAKASAPTSSEVQPFSECISETPVSGTATDGTFTCTVSIPKGTVNGDWPLLVIVVDAAGNQRAFVAADLAGLGFASKIAVTSPTPDQTPPTFVSLTVSPAAVDVRTGAKTVTATARLTDANSGVARFDFALRAPNGVVANCASGSPTTGTVNDGDWSCTLTIPAGAPSGDWALFVRATDAATFFREYNPTVGYPAGFPTKVTVTGQ